VVRAPLRDINLVLKKKKGNKNYRNVTSLLLRGKQRCCDRGVEILRGDIKNNHIKNEFLEEGREELEIKISNEIGRTSTWPSDQPTLCIQN
jgi:hypothetical protein